MVISDYKFKKEDNRYCLVEYLETLTLTMDKNSYEDFLNQIKKSNCFIKNSILCGNVVREKIDEDNILVTYHRYRVLSGKAGISKIDEYTIGFDEKDLKRVFSANNKIILAYMNSHNGIDIGIRDIPVLYKCNEIFLNPDVICEQLRMYALNDDYDFFIALANRFEAYKKVEDDVSNLRNAVNCCRFYNFNKKEMYYVAVKLFNHFIHDSNSEVKMRSLRDFGLFLRDYGIRYDSSNYALDLFREHRDEVLEGEMIERKNDRILEDCELDRWDDEWENGVGFKLKLK